MSIYSDEAHFDFNDFKKDVNWLINIARGSEANKFITKWEKLIIKYGEDSFEDGAQRSL